MYRASPPRRVPAFSKAAVNAVQAVPSAEGDFVNLYRSTMRHEGGFAQGEFAILPDLPNYDHLRFVFGPLTTAGTVSGATVTVWSRGSDGSVTRFGSSDLAADNSFPAIEAESYQATFAVTVSGLSGAGATVSFDVSVQGVHVGYVA